jgi:hypothetical protein
VEGNGDGQQLQRLAFIIGDNLQSVDDRTPRSFHPNGIGVNNAYRKFVQCAVDDVENACAKLVFDAPCRDGKVLLNSSAGVDQKIVARIAPGSFVQLLRQAGNHLFRARAVVDNEDLRSWAWAIRKAPAGKQCAPGSDRNDWRRRICVHNASILHQAIS